MGWFSKGSIGMVVLGVFLLGINWITADYSEPLVLIGVLCLLAGAILSFSAVAKREKGKAKFVSLITFFIVLFFITWTEPFQILRVLTWLKNIV